MVLRVFGSCGEAPVTLAVDASRAEVGLETLIGRDVTGAMLDVNALSGAESLWEVREEREAG
jgi:hypothetical protein